MKYFVVLAALLVLVSFASLVSGQECKCPNDYDPVCGRDMRTYPNACTLKCAKQRKAHDGVCKKRVYYAPQPENKDRRRMGH